MDRIHSLEPTAAAARRQTLRAATREAIEAPIHKYIEGGRRGDSSIMKPAFHENAQMSGPSEAGAFSGPIQALYDYVDDNPPATELGARIVDVTVSDARAASVGDVATLQGPDTEAIHPNEISKVTSASVYDVLMHVNPSLPRYVV